MDFYAPIEFPGNSTKRRLPFVHQPFEVESCCCEHHMDVVSNDSLPIVAERGWPAFKRTLINSISVYFRKCILFFCCRHLLLLSGKFGHSIRVCLFCFSEKKRRGCILEEWVYYHGNDDDEQHIVQPHKIFERFEFRISFA
jgi:hypothetical protein